MVPAYLGRIIALLNESNSIQDKSEAALGRLAGEAKRSLRS